MRATLPRLAKTGWSPREPAPLRLAGFEVHLWSVSLDQPAAEVTRLAACLSADERARAARYCFERDRRRFTVARATLRQVLSRYRSGDAAALRFQYGAHGKPSLSDVAADAGPAFNVAHSRDVGLIAVSAGAALGVDIECIRPLHDVPGLAQQVCSPAERQALAELAPAQRVPAFLRCWTRKEACAKAMGTGLSAPLERLHVGCAGAPAGPGGWVLYDLDLAPGWVGALATSHGEHRITPFHFDGPAP